MQTENPEFTVAGHDLSNMQTACTGTAAGHGLINVCKPRGMTSFRALSLVKRRLGLTKVGHLGTLDPLACGVLVLLCGRATKLATRLHAGTKVYRALFVWGQETDTLDDAGTVVATSTVIPTTAQIQAVLPTLVGEVQMQVPKYSAVHIHGQRAYDLARRGVAFTPPTKTVHITAFQLLTNQECVQDLQAIGESYVPPTNAHYFEITCAAGTYVRSLAKVLATKLGTVATASVILRTRVGPFDIKDAQPLNLVSRAALQAVDRFLDVTS